MNTNVHTTRMLCSIFFLNHTSTPKIYTLSLHDALPILGHDGLIHVTRVVLALNLVRSPRCATGHRTVCRGVGAFRMNLDRKSTRLNSSHSQISYAVFCLKKKINMSFP